MPYLARTGRIDVTRLDVRPPANLHDIHVVLTAGLRDVEVKLQLVERAYYGLQDVGYGSSRDAAEAEVARWASAIRPMLSAAGLMAFLSLEQVNDAAHRRDMDADVILQLQEQQQQQHQQSQPQQRERSKSKLKRKNTLNGAGKSVSDDDAAPVDRTQTEAEIGDGTAEEPNADEKADEDKAVNGDGKHSSAATPAEDPVSANRGTSASLSNLGEDCESVDEQNDCQPNTAVDTANSDGPPSSPTPTTGDILGTFVEPVDDALFALSRTLRDCVRKVLDAVPSRFDNVIADLRQIQRHLTKYCISFYGDVDTSFDPSTSGQQKNVHSLSTSSSSSLLGTAATYHLQIKLRQRAIHAHLSSVRDLVNRFRTSELRLSDLGADGADLARRAGAAHAPFLLLFPVACSRIRAAADEMRSWLADDAAYGDFIANDVVQLETRVRSIETQLRNVREEFHRLAFRARTVADECERVTVELEKTHSREKQLIVDEEILASETSELKTEADTTEYRRAEVSFGCCRP